MGNTRRPPHLLSAPSSFREEITNHHLWIWVKDAMRYFDLNDDDLSRLPQAIVLDPITHKPLEDQGSPRRYLYHVRDLAKLQRSPEAADHALRAFEATNAGREQDVMESMLGYQGPDEGGNFDPDGVMFRVPSYVGGWADATRYKKEVLYCFLSSFTAYFQHS